MRRLRLLRGIRKKKRRETICELRTLERVGCKRKRVVVGDDGRGDPENKKHKTKQNKTNSNNNG